MKSHYIKEDIIKSLHRCGIKKGDNVFVTSSLGMFGLLKGAKNIDDINSAFYSSLSECVGETGSIIVPTYSYTFGKHRITSPVTFDTQKSKAEIGPFPEFFRRQTGVIRSADPFMSVAIKGPLSALVRELIPTSYGHGCLYEKLLGQEVICLNLGLGPNWTAFIHYADYLAQVPFRYDKLFSGVFAGQNDVQQWLYSVPLLCAEAKANAHSVGLAAEKRGIWSYTELGRGRVYKASYDKYFNFVMSELRSDEWALAEGNPCDVKQLEIERCNILKSDLAKGGAITHYTNELVGSLAKRFHLQLESFDTGYNAFDHVMPEGWYCASVSVKDDQGNKLPVGVDSVTPYSQGFAGEISGNELQRHIDIPAQFPRYIERDWSLSIDSAQINKSATYDVKLDCGSYFSHAAVAFKKGSFRYVYVINVSDFDKKPELYQSKLACLVNSPFSILIVSHEVAMVAWLAKYQKQLEYNQEVQLLCAAKDSSWYKWDFNGYNRTAKTNLLAQNYSFRTIPI